MDSVEFNCREQERALNSSLMALESPQQVMREVLRTVERERERNLRAHNVGVRMVDQESCGRYSGGGTLWRMRLCRVRA